LAGKWLRRQQPPRCALDGLAIEPIYLVHVVDREGVGRGFCCIGCAEAWLKRHGARPRVVRVTDEASGALLEQERAFFVASAVVTNPVTGNYVHVFASRMDAEKHVHVFGGKLLENSERPFVTAKGTGGP
jgi:hypothetical protein